MLLSLAIRDFVLVRQLELSFAPGFSVLTGETGAGKSILLGALGLALGGRAEGDSVRTGAERSEIAVEFGFAEDSAAAAWLLEHDLPGDPGVCLLRRTVEAGGRSRAQINGVTVTLAQLKALGECLIDIHGQHAHYSLLKPARQLALLDDALGQMGQMVALAMAWRGWRAAEQTLLEAETQGAALAQALAQWQWVADDLGRLALQVGEWATLNTEHGRLAHAAELASGTGTIAAEVSGEDAAVLSQVVNARQRLAALSELDPALAEPLALFDSAVAELDEAARYLTRYAAQAELDPQALAQAETRLADITTAARRHQVSVDALPAYRDTARGHLDAALRSADIDGLRAAATAAGALWQTQADAVSAARRAGALPLAQRVTETMQGLAMAGGSFAIEITPSAPSAQGQDTVNFMVAPHAGQGLKPLAQTASGGELSRIGLALQTVVSAQSGAETLIFDEIDAGIGGRVAGVVGQQLEVLGRTRQIICVTHLPQVAAAAAQQFAVTKRVLDGQAVSEVRRLNAAERVEEIARMLGGLEMTAATRAHAAELLGPAA
jgi:DNA repair protein RecN (Recombination protein N)